MKYKRVVNTLALYIAIAAFECLEYLRHVGPVMKAADLQSPTIKAQNTFLATPSLLETRQGVAGKDVGVLEPTKGAPGVYRLTVFVFPQEHHLAARARISVSRI
jgi:hypothetical protein